MPTARRFGCGNGESSRGLGDAMRCELSVSVSVLIKEDILCPKFGGVCGAEPSPRTASSQAAPALRLQRSENRNQGTFGVAHACLTAAGSERG